MHHGNPGHRAVVRHVLSLACTPIYDMLTQWLLDGTLEDPHHEFFIASNPTVPDDKLWQDKYSIRYSYPLLHSAIATISSKNIYGFYLPLLKHFILGLLESACGIT